MSTLRLGARGILVKRLQKALNALGYNAGTEDGIFGQGTFTAVKQFQKDNDLDDDGVVGRSTHAELAIELDELENTEATSETLNEIDNEAQNQAPNQATELELAKCPPTLVARICHDSSRSNIAEHWPLIFRALVERDLSSKQMMLMAIATVYVETGRFAPIDEYVSRYNTSPNGHPFDKYDDRNALGNTGKPDGARYKGRGYIQLTGRANYRVIGNQIGLGDKLEKDPELANDPTVAANILAQFLKNKEHRIEEALKQNNLKDARKAVNGGSHGLTDFKRIYKLGAQLVPEF